MDDDDVAGELASLVGDEPAAATAAADPAAAFFEQGEPYRDDRWKQGS